MQSLARMAEAAEEELAAEDKGQQLVLASASGVEASPSAEGAQSQGQGIKWGLGRGGGSVFASMSMGGFALAPHAGARMGMGRATHVVLDALSKAAKAVPLTSGRPRLSRPVRKQASRPQQQ